MMNEDGGTGEREGEETSGGRETHLPCQVFGVC